MNFTYENQGTNTYLVYTVSADDTIDSMTLGMLTNNKIPGLATAVFTQMDLNKYIKYNVSAHIPANQFFAGAVNKKRLLGVFKGIVNAVLSAEEYMIDGSSFLLDLDYIYADVTTCETLLVCLPIEREIKRCDLGAFFKHIMFSTQFDQTENCDYVAKIINYLNSTPLFSVNDFKELLETIEKTDVSPAGAAVPPHIDSPKVEQPVQKREDNKNPPSVQTSMPSVQPVVPSSRSENRNAGVIPTGSVPATSSTCTASDASSDKVKGGSLFGLFSSKGKKENPPQTSAAKKAAGPAYSATVPNRPSSPTPGFAIPGQTMPPAATPVPAAAAVPAMPSAPAKHVQQPVAPAHVRPASQPPFAPHSQAMNFGETTVLGGGNVGETTVLGAVSEAVQPKPHLIRLKNNEKINLDKPVYRVGKEKSYVDYFISDNTAISRSHANFISRDGEYFVVDTNSTNHTYVNGTMIQSGSEVKLAHGDKVRLANEEFEFKLY